MRVTLAEPAPALLAFLRVLHNFFFPNRCHDKQQMVRFPAGYAEPWHSHSSTCHAMLVKDETMRARAAIPGLSVPVAFGVFEIAFDRPGRFISVDGDWNA